MNEFNPGDGWREVQYGADLAGHESIVWESTGKAGGTARMWVRVAPVPPLPTEPYTVIRVTFRPSSPSPWDPVFTLKQDKHDAHEVYWSNGAAWSTESLVERITGFEVLSEPRAVTAKAVRDRVRQTGIWQVVLLANPKNGDELDKIARDFGVES